MGTLYESIRSLCDEKGIKGGKMCVDLGISKSTMTDLKSGRRTGISLDTAQKIADYFGVSVDRVLGSEQKEKSPAPDGVGLNEDQKKAIEKILSLPPEELTKKMAALEAVLSI